MINNSDSIVVKTVYNHEVKFTTTDIDINKLNPKSDDEFIVNIIGERLFRPDLIYCSEPKEFKLAEQKEAIEIKIGEKITFDLEKRNYFRFEYVKENDNQTLYFFFNTSEEFYIIFFENDNYKILEYYVHKDNKFKLNSPGIYYISLIGNQKYPNMNNNTFTTYISGGIFDTINFSKKLYQSSFNFTFYSFQNPLIIKVK